MSLHRNDFFLGLTACAIVMASVAAARAEEESKPADQKIELAEGKLQLTISGGWKKIAPKSRIIDFEFTVPPVEGDEQAGRVTIMGAGGSIEANIDRWVAQFSQPDGGDTKERAKINEKTVGGQQLHVVDISGTYDDRPPFAGGGVMREKYRMLSLIIQTEKLGNYFVKFYGPEATVAKNKAAFEAMVNSLQAK